jgi:hypothetical protein
MDDNPEGDLIFNHYLRQSLHRTWPRVTKQDRPAVRKALWQ